MSESSVARTSAYPVVGVDLGKDCMHLTALDTAGNIAHRARCTRSTVLPSLLRLDADLIAIEAWGL